MSEKRIQELESKLQERDEELARYRSELKKLNLQLKDLIQQISLEVKTAQAIQRTLVPSEIPTIPGVEFSHKFIASFVSGGDYFDIFEHEDKYRFGAIVSASSGYGMSALFLAVLMKLSGRMESRKRQNPAEALLGMLDELKPEMHDSDSADVFYGIIDRRTFELEYALAGDILALHFTQAEGGIARVKSLAPKVSKEFLGPLAPAKVRLDSRDRLVICTPGIFDAKNSKGEAFGSKRVEEAIFAKKNGHIHDVRNEILYQVEKFTGTSEPERDQTLMVLEVKEKVLKLART